MTNKKKSSFCSGGSCVEVDKDSFPKIVHVYDDWGNRCTFSNAEWAEFIKGVKSGEFDIKE